MFKDVHETHQKQPAGKMRFFGIDSRAAEDLKASFVLCTSIRERPTPPLEAAMAAWTHSYATPMAYRRHFSARLPWPPVPSDPGRY